MNFLDLSKFEKSAEDKGTVTLKHRDHGHTITILTSKISPIQKEALKKLNMSKYENEDNKKEKLAKGGKIKRHMYADGSEDVSSDDDAPTTDKGPEIVPRETSQVIPENQNQVSAVSNTSTIPQGSGEMVKQGVAGIGENAQVEAGKAQLNAEDLAKRDAQFQQYKIDQDKNVAEVAKHAKDYEDYVNSNPRTANAYWDNQNTAQKVTNAIGMLLGGIGGSGAHAMDFLKSQISQAAQAQQDNITNKNNVWHAYETLYHDKNIANNLTLASGEKQLANQIQQTAARLGTAQAKANADASAAKFNMDALAHFGVAGKLKTDLERGYIPQTPGPAGQKAIQQRQQNQNIQGQQKASHNQQKPKEEEDTILAPNALDKIKSLQYGSDQDKANYPKALEAYQNASQADQILGQLHGIHSQMYDLAKAGGGEGYMRRHDPTKEIPFIGGLASSLVTQPGTATETNKTYDTLKTAITGDIANALKGTNIGGEEIQKIVDANAPEPKDSPGLVKEKEHRIRTYIKNALAKSNAALELAPGALRRGN